jgi:hypothetical protein
MSAISGGTPECTAVEHTLLLLGVQLRLRTRTIMSVMRHGSLAALPLPEFSRLGATAHGRKQED